MRHSPAPASAALLYQQEGFDTGRAKLMGRHAASEGFLKGFVQHAGVEALYCYTSPRESAKHFEQRVAGFGNQRDVIWLNDADASTPRLAGTLHLPDPNLVAAAWRRRALELFDWSVVIHRYQALWLDLAERRSAAAESAALQPGHAAHPARMDPFTCFASYPSRVLRSDDRLSALPGADMTRLQVLLSMPLFGYMQRMAPEPHESARLLASVQQQGACSVAELLAAQPEPRRAVIERGLVWLAKLGLLSIRPAP